MLEAPKKGRPARTPAERTDKEPVVRVMAPMTCRDSECEKDTVVFVTAKNQLHIRVSDLPWVVDDMASELNVGTIPEPEDPDVLHGSENDSSVAESRSSWSPAGYWTVTVQRGALKGKEFISHVKDMNQEKWEKGSRLAGCAGDLKSATWQAQKKALLAWLEDAVRQRIDAEKRPDSPATPS